MDARRRVVGGEEDGIEAAPAKSRSSNLQIICRKRRRPFSQCGEEIEDSGLSDRLAVIEEEREDDREGV